MVLRKSLPEDNLVPRPLSHAANNPPYPTTPSDEHPPVVPTSSEHHEVYSPDLNTSPAFNLKPLDGAQQQKPNDHESDYSSDDDWDKSDYGDSEPEEIPSALKIGGGKPLPATSKNSLPDSLRAGPPAGIAVKKPEPISPEPTGTSAASSYGAASNGSGSIPLQTNNPYLRMQNTGQSTFGAESSQNVWGDLPSQAQSYGEAVELPTTAQTPIEATSDLSKMNLNSSVPPVPSHQPPPVPPQQSHEPLHQPPLIAVDPASPFEAPQRTWQEQQAWEQSERERHQRELAAASEAASRAEQERRHEEEFHQKEQASKFTPSASPFEEDHAPALPPRRSQEEEHPPVMPPRPLETGVIGAGGLGPESPMTVMNRQRKEHYQIKHVRWYDASVRETRVSPILTQNINGPCPLLALVNALVLSTPANLDTALAEALRTREQVSLGLLLDAVFDELMSGRRGDAAQVLPDVGELYKFLLALHTGLNVNPMFVQDPAATDGLPAMFSSLPIQPGGFENSKDMRLYKTFDIPLMHGWTPDPGSEAYVAFERVARTYEDAQHVQFQLEELDAKLQSYGLTEDEQRMFTDIHAIKEFLSRWPTQLTDHGLHTIREYIMPGQIGILFRNDHFSTVYKDPSTNQIHTLVTDAGYSTHDEIVWESLVDVTGQGSELYSGDFRAVGNNSNPQRQQTQQPVQSLLDVGDESSWTTVQPRRGNQQRTSSGGALDSSQTNEPLSPALSRTEQEDHDLALALQLQEEEEARHRRSLEERRRRENELSESAIAANTQSGPRNRRTPRAGENPPLIPPRRNNVVTHRPNNEPAPPPTYEEAATTPQYHPPQGHPASPMAPIRQGSAYMQNTNTLPPNMTGQSQGGRRNSRPIGLQNPMHPRPGRRQSAGVGGPNGQEDRDKCVVM
ncbi:hypothetical protein BDV96DRAFT_494023 [Lophiotrema nucula]|uniref:MINDY deubiquitinase domain-containing protein n=1 Tax=Lophiotrema nucula TaxID=690887 RepID=A0A6A5Z6H1_9PLEO|nr:hypothetical protein BDV96DRAFT_494023 [Lophiotrema nucula]